MSVGSLKKIFWRLVIITAFVGAVYQVTSIWLEYFRYDVSVSMTFTYQRQAVFPAVKFCHMNPVRRSAVVSNSQLKALTSQTQTVQKRRRRRIFENKTNFVPSHAADQHSFMEHVARQPVVHAQSLLASDSQSVQLHSDINVQGESPNTASLTSELQTQRKQPAMLSRHKRSSTYAWHSIVVIACSFLLYFH